MRTVHSRARAEIEVTMPVRVKDSVQACPVRNTDGPRRKPRIKICIVRRIDLQVLIKDPVERIIKTEGDCRISLKPHSLVKAIEIHSRDRWILRLMVRL